MAIRFNHLHVKGSRPRQTARWYMRWFEAILVSDDHRMADGSMAVILDLGGARLFVSGNPPGAKLAPANAEQHAGLEHFAITLTGELEPFVHSLKAANVRVLVPPFTNRYGTRIAFIEGPDQVRIELVHYPSAAQTQPSA